jgi:hypothetical protein
MDQCDASLDASDDRYALRANTLIPSLPQLDQSRHLLTLVHPDIYVSTFPCFVQTQWLSIHRVMIDNYTNILQSTPTLNRLLLLSGTAINNVVKMAQSYSSIAHTIINCLGHCICNSFEHAVGDSISDWSTSTVVPLPWLLQGADCAGHDTTWTRITNRWMPKFVHTALTRAVSDINCHYIANRPVLATSGHIWPRDVDATLALPLVMQRTASVNDVATNHSDTPVALAGSVTNTTRVRGTTTRCDNNKSDAVAAIASIFKGLCALAMVACFAGRTPSLSLGRRDGRRTRPSDHTNDVARITASSASDVLPLICIGSSVICRPWSQHVDPSAPPHPLYL